MKSVIILGSGQNAVNTSLVADFLASQANIDIVDLQKYEFTDFDYKHSNKSDAFLPLVQEIIEHYDNLIFCTPVYWYSMSAVMKKFFDRMSDLLKIEKDLGRRLRGKSMFVISCSGSDDQGDYFFTPFRLSAEYLGMIYLGDIHTVVEHKEIWQKSKNALQNTAINIS